MCCTSKVEHIAAFTAIFSNICTAHVQKRLFMNFRCKFRHRRSIRRPRFPVRVQNFGDLVTFSIDFCILYSECAPYFYFRFVWPTNLASMWHMSTPTLIIPTKFDVDMTIHCRVTAFLSADTSCDLDLWPFEQLSYMAGHVTNPATSGVLLKMEVGIRKGAWQRAWRYPAYLWLLRWVYAVKKNPEVGIRLIPAYTPPIHHCLPPSLKTLQLFVHELRVITVPIDYHWKCIHGHCACAESRDPWVKGEKRLHFWNPRPWFACSLYNFCGSMMNIIKVICENNAHPVLKNVWDSAQCAKSRDLFKVAYMSYCSRSRRRRFTLLDFKSWAYNLIYGHFQQHLYCACAETVIYALPV